MVHFTFFSLSSLSFCLCCWFFFFVFAKFIHFDWSSLLISLLDDININCSNTQFVCCFFFLADIAEIVKILCRNPLRQFFCWASTGIFYLHTSKQMCTIVTTIPHPKTTFTLGTSNGYSYCQGDRISSDKVLKTATAAEQTRTKAKQSGNGKKTSEQTTLHSRKELWIEWNRDSAKKSKARSKCCC